MRAVTSSEEETPRGSCSSECARYWTLDPSVTFLNHGSFGACPLAVLEAQQHLRERVEKDPVQFFRRDLEPLWDEALHQLSEFLGAVPEQLAFVPNTTTGINTILRSIQLERGAELLTTTHSYPACRNALEEAAARVGGTVVAVQVPFPLRTPAQVLQPILEAITPKTQIALFDHVASSTGIIFPIERIIQELAAMNIDVLVDGAHAPGMVPLELERLGAAYYVGNCHKWLCAPKGAGFLYVRRDKQPSLHPLVISHGARSFRTDRSRFRLEFDWTGTHDPTSYLTVPVAIHHIASLVEGGWPTVRERNRLLVLAGRRRVCTQLNVETPCPDTMVGSLAAIPFPDSDPHAKSEEWTADPEQEALFAQYRIEVPISPWPARPKRLLRLSAHLYNSPSQYNHLAAALKEILQGIRGEA